MSKYSWIEELVRNNEYDEAYEEYSKIIHSVNLCCLNKLGGNSRIELSHKEYAGGCAKHTRNHKWERCVNPSYFVIYDIGRS